MKKNILVFILLFTTLISYSQNRQLTGWSFNPWSLESKIINNIFTDSLFAKNKVKRRIELDFRPIKKQIEIIDYHKNGKKFQSKTSSYYKNMLLGNGVNYTVSTYEYDKKGFLSLKIDSIKTLLLNKKSRNKYHTIFKHLDKIDSKLLKYENTQNIKIVVDSTIYEYEYLNKKLLKSKEYLNKKLKKEFRFENEKIIEVDYDDKNLITKYELNKYSKNLNLIKSIGWEKTQLKTRSNFDYNYDFEIEENRIKNIVMSSPKINNTKYEINYNEKGLITKIKGYFIDFKKGNTSINKNIYQYEYY